MIRHAKNLTQPDGPDDALGRPSDWNAGHLAPAFVVPFWGGSLTWSNMPTAATEFPGTYRVQYDLTHADDVRLVAYLGVQGSASATLKAQYSTDGGTNWADLTATIALNPAGPKASARGAVPAQAKADVLIRLLGQSGDATADPQFRFVQLQVR